MNASPVTVLPAASSLARVASCVIVASIAAAPQTSFAADGDAGPWWVGHLLTAGAAILGALLIVYQLGRQHKNELAQQVEGHRAQLRLQVYQEFSARLATCSAAIQEVSMYAFTAPAHADIYRQQVEMGLRPQPIAERAMHFLGKHSAACDQVVEMIFLIERYLIVSAELDIFRMALSSAMHDLRKAFHDLFVVATAFFPMDATGPDGVVSIENVKVLSVDDVERLRAAATTYFEDAQDVGAYLDDMRTELQELLLSYLFPTRLPRRRPSDPSKKVITLDPLMLPSLRYHFLKNTEWGKHSTEVQMSVHKKFHS